MIGIVDCDLGPSCYAAGDNNDSFHASPIELLKLTVRVTRVIYEPCEVPCRIHDQKEGNETNSTNSTVD
jgi:hypothetical protein